MMHKIKNAMLIDGEEIDQKTYQRVLKRSGLVEKSKVFTYADEALEYLKAYPEERPDIIFLDINMPRMNGFEFIEAATNELGAYFAGMIIVMLTTSLDPRDRDRAQQSGVVKEFMIKPLSVEKILYVSELRAASIEPEG
jgi:CheY-like chemotaxis protein